MNPLIRVFRNHRSFAYLLGLGFLTAVCLFLWSSFDGEPEARPPPKVCPYSVSFQGYSSAVNGERRAIFMITNPGCETLYFVGQGWIEVARASSNETRDIPGLFPIAVLPRSSTNFAVKIPPEAKCWRVGCVLQPVGPHDKLYDFLRIRGIPHYLIPVRCPRGPDALITEWIRE